MKKKLLILALAIALCGIGPATASGFPVIDVAKLTQDAQSQVEGRAMGWRLCP